MSRVADGSGGKRREGRGVRGGKRAHQRHVDPRNHPDRVRSREQIAAEQAALDARVAQGRADTAAALDRRRVEAEEAARAAVRAQQDQRRADARAAAVRAEAAAQAAREQAERRRADWTLGQARALIRQGYAIEQAARLTGWDEGWLTP